MDAGFNENDLIDPLDEYSPTHKDVEGYVGMGYSRSGAICSLRTTNKNRAEKEEKEYFETADANDQIRNEEEWDELEGKTKEPHHPADYKEYNS